MKTIDILIETVAGSREKFNYHPETGFFKFKKALAAGMHFPFDFGCITGTLGGDGDALDVMIISEFKTFTGCVIECRIIGCMEANQTEKEKGTFRNDRFFAIPVESVTYHHVQSLDDIPVKLMEDIKAFFVQYNLLEGKELEIIGELNPAEAWNAIEKGMQEYEKHHS